VPRIHICSLSRLHDTVTAARASHLVTLINEGTPVTRPASIAPERHLFLAFNDIVSPLDGMTAPGPAHIHSLIGFLDGWDRTDPMVVHCFAGISRSTAAAFIALCALAPGRDEREIAQALRNASPIATPNPLMVELADGILGRQGRMVEAIGAIGRGREAFEGHPFALPLAG
jgi:predicted protein tyrosine phosphatase